MAKFDPRKPPDWVRRMMARATHAKAGPIRAERAKGERRTGGRREDAGSPAVALGCGTFVAPLPAGWSLHPARAFEGRLRLAEGHDVFYRIDSYEDAEAAAGGPRILAYADELEFKDMVKTPGDVVGDFLISIPDRDPAGKDIVWKCVEPFAGTHVRELVLRCPLLTDELVERRMSLARAVGEWMGLGRFAPEPSALDRAAHTAALERVNFQDSLMMRVPRRWTVATEGEQKGRKRFAVAEPERRETIRVTSRFAAVPQGTDAEEFLAEAAENAWSGALAPNARDWQVRRREELPEGDVLMITSHEEGEAGDTHRRLSWLRYGIRDGCLVWAPVHLVTPTRHLDEPAQIESEALLDREVRNAILAAPVPPDRETA